MHLIGTFHSFVVYFPILFFVLAIVADLFHFYGKSSAFKVGHWCIIFGWIATIPAILTGVAAMQDFKVVDEILLTHRSLGYATGVAASFYSGLRISAMIWTLPLKPGHYLGLSVMMAALVSWTSTYGALASLPGF